MPKKPTTPSCSPKCTTTTSTAGWSNTRAGCSRNMNSIRLAPGRKTRLKLQVRARSAEPDGGRQAHVEPRAHVLRHIGEDAAIAFGELAGDGEAEPGAAGPGRALEGDEQIVDGARRQAGPVVDKAQGNAVSILAEPNGHRRLGNLS